ncbi:hypothetical protein H257_16196 [Aphanomyces astaci]|uniref:Uncharacterized protein n=1 Tax=Aphanomyces astaci TaxID=112090 RepID=W4FJC8_APHAT|nr:hypothetical protein H257_16196 [Aphanomyces astaci]ETV67597.1 hypothetical protein H257_16196 [Aphanomyces astaci]|eukprot:XP_009842854.1 hypothetical protein H257_16196 [Aphanomyces astaci]
MELRRYSLYKLLKWYLTTIGMQDEASLQQLVQHITRGDLWSKYVATVKKGQVELNGSIHYTTVEQLDGSYIVSYLKDSQCENVYSVRLLHRRWQLQHHPLYNVAYNRAWNICPVPTPVSTIQIANIHANVHTPTVLTRSFIEMAVPEGQKERYSRLQDRFKEVTAVAVRTDASYKYAMLYLNDLLSKLST